MKTLIFFYNFSQNCITSTDIVFKYCRIVLCMYIFVCLWFGLKHLFRVTFIKNKRGIIANEGAIHQVKVYVAIDQYIVLS